ncbi:hypothetical protein CCICO_04480 [Corynebacterium ciconiae DSM 44920]|uniref:phage holin n=1 Tax=Corynebacterium ciconiae TaxID=227319 RepID=UPI002649E8DF|nr:hypothetical protein [Corynebacterium ciconiae]WKD60933.1 hypothetical protein CCICO_04480 [Corynebacterium ciconiae DSM 44920]
MTLDSIRAAVPASYRGTLYAVVAAVAPALIAWGVLGEEQAAAVVGVATAAVTLLFAVIHSTSSVRTAVYGVIAAVTAALAVWGYGDPAQWDTILAIVAPALGMGVAAANTPAGEDYTAAHAAE